MNLTLKYSQGISHKISYQNKDSAFENFFPFYVQYHVFNAFHSDIVFLSKVKTTKVVVELILSQSSNLVKTMLMHVRILKKYSNRYHKKKFIFL